MKPMKLRAYALITGCALIAILILRSEFIDGYSISSESMIPTLLVGDYLLTNKFVYGLNLPFLNRKILILTSPQRGDIINFRSPEDPRRNLTKRVVAIEGDFIEERNRRIFLNGKPVDELYVQYMDNFLENPRDNFGPFAVPEGKLFTMGDNRDRSYDSRYFGFVDVKDVEGKAFLLYWSWDGERHLPRFDRIGHFLSNR